MTELSRIPWDELNLTEQTQVINYFFTLFEAEKISASQFMNLVIDLGMLGVNPFTWDVGRGISSGA